MNDTEAHVRDIFLSAVEAGDRSSYLDEACGDDKKLRCRVEELLASHEQAGDFLTPPDIGRESVPPVAPAEGPGTVIGRYKLLQEIGEGGFGVVYMAQQQTPVNRKVALKIIKLGMDTRQVIARFEAERQALAMMDHSNIARVLDAGATDTGRPYFVMDLVRGMPITEYCDQNNLTTQERLELFVDVCRAVQHAHQKGIIHRDIKPTNVLVTIGDGRPLPKVIDFGIAKATQQRLTEKTLYTDYRQFVGTPQYMSPEQATMSDGDVDTRTDIYSLGVLLYELLAGCTPYASKRFSGVGYDEICRIIRDEDPPTPSRRLSTLADAETTNLSHARQTQPAALQRVLRSDLDWIVMKALEKDRSRRYASVNDLASDVRRYLNNETIEACQPSSWYAFRKFVRRNRTVITPLILVAASLLLGTIVSTLLAVRASIARKEADEAREQSVDLRYVSDMNRAMQALDDRDSQLVHQLLRDHHPGSPSSDGADRRGWEWFYLWRACRDTMPTLHHDHIVNDITILPDGRTLVSGDTGGNLHVWDMATQRLLDSVHAHRSRVLNVVSTSDGRLLSSGHDNDIRIWTVDPATGRLVNDGNLEGQVDIGNWQVVACSQDGKIAASGGYEGNIRLWNLVNRKVVTQISSGSSVALALDREGHTLAQHRKNDVAVWHAPFTDRKPDFVIPGLDNIGGVGLVFSPDGRLLAASSADDGAQLWSVPEKKLLHRLGSSTVIAAAFSPDGKKLALGSTQKTVSIYNTATGEKLDEMDRHSGEIRDVHFTPDGATLASASMDKTVRIWHLPQAGANDGPPSELHCHVARVDDVAFSQDGNWLATSEGQWVDTGNSKVVLWDTRTWQCREFSGSRFAFSHDSQLLAIPDEEMNTVQLWDVRARQFLPGLPMDGSRDSRLTFSHDGKLAVGQHGMLKLWNTSERKLLARYPLSSLQTRLIFELDASPDGRMLALTDLEGDVALLDATNLNLLQLVPEALDLWGHVIAFAPDSSCFVTPDYGHAVKMWSVRDGKLKPLSPLRGHTASAVSAAFSRQGILAVGCANGQVRLWDMATWTERATVQCHDKSVTSLCFSPDGHTLVTGCKDGTVRFFWAASPEEVLNAESKGEDPLRVDSKSSQ